jgi:hypothetical protein
MKRICTLLAALATFAATSQFARAEDSLESQLNTRLGKESSSLSTGAKAKEIVRGNVTYGGSAVEAYKTGSPLQLFNPFAPAKYDSGDDNVMRDTATGRASAWKLFSIAF